MKTAETDSDLEGGDADSKGGMESALLHEETERGLCVMLSFP